MCVHICSYKGGDTHKKVGGRNLVTNMAAVGGSGRGTLPGAENYKMLLKK